MSAWKTGKPQESGYYNIKFKPSGRWRWFGEQVVKWCPIPEDEEGENG